MSDFKTSELRDTSQELQELRAQLKEAKRDNELMMLNLSQCGQQLAASQAREQQLRDALRGVLKDDAENNVLSFDLFRVCCKATALASDTTALEAMIQKAGEVMRERCCYEQYKMEDRNACAVSFAIRALPGVTLGDLK